MSDNNQSIQGAEEDDDRMQNQHQHQKKRRRRRKKKSDEEEEEEEEKKKKGGVKNLILVPFRKFEKLCTTRKQRSTRLPPSQSPSPEEEDFLLGKGCHPHLCFSHPRVALDSPTRPDPDVKPSSYHDFLRSMIEKNDFYSPECNVHI